MSPRLTAVFAAVVSSTLAVTGLACASAKSPRVSVTRRIPYTANAELDVYRPRGRDGLPVIVTLHGCCGSRDNLAPLASRLAENGTVVFNASWRGTDSDAGGFPGAYEDAACAVRFARATARDHGGDPRWVTLVGWSDGALVGGVVADAGGDFAHGCRTGAAEAAGAGAAGERGAVPDSFVALGGFFGWDPAGDGGVGAGYVNDRSVRFFGGRPTEVPEAWAAGNPYTHLRRNPGVPFRMVVGEDDPLLVDARCFSRAAQAAGHPVGLSVAKGAGHQTIIAPQYPEGALAVREILYAARQVASPPPPDVDPPEGPCPGTAP